MPENQTVLFWGLNLGVLRILLFQGRAESPMERLAQGKRSGTLGWVIVSKTIYALKGQKRGYCPGCRFACPGHPMLSTKF